jgi:hypothetical protein
MNAYECSALELAMRYLDVAHAQLLLDEMNGVPGIHDARRALATAEEEVAKAYQARQKPTPLCRMQARRLCCVVLG